MWQKTVSTIAATHVGYISPDLLYTSCTSRGGECTRPPRVFWICQPRTEKSR